MSGKMWKFSFAYIASLALLSGALGTDILKTNGFSNCIQNSTITVNNVDLSFDRSTNIITFDVSGTSSETQEVMASLIITAYGNQIYEKDFDPCAADTKVEQLCPVPAGTFAAQGSQQIPSSYTDMIPSIAYSVPDLEGNAQIVLKSRNGGQEVACVQSGISNGKTVEVPAVSYIAAAIAVSALALTAVSALAAGGHPGSSSSSPGFMEVIWWFQGMSMNGMHSVPYPTIYRSFSKNFAFSTGLIPWAGMQNTIDNFRQHTGGDLTDDNYNFLKNATLVYSDNSTSTTSTNVARRGLDLAIRAFTTSVNGSSSSSSTSSTSKEAHFVTGIQAYVEQLTIPQANTFMTVLLIFAIVVAAVVLGILLFKVILEAWALFGKFPKSLTTFRKEYWRVMAQTITSLIFLLYGSWTLYCIYQFTHGDSWAAKLLAGLTLGVFTAILGYYVFKIWSVVRQLRNTDRELGLLFENKETWKKYHNFYGDYKRTYWWIFMPAIVYMFAKGCVLAAADGHGLVQTIGQLVIEALMLGLLLWSRPYNRRSGNWINVFIQIVRVASVVCILVFVEELGISQTTKTVTGIVLIAVQASLTCILAVLIAVNSLITCFRENPHRRKRKEDAEKRKSQADELTDFGDNDAFLMRPQPYKGSPIRTPNRLSGSTMGQKAYEPVRGGGAQNPRFSFMHTDSSEGLVPGAARFAIGDGKTKGLYQSVSHDTEDAGSPPPVNRQPTLPKLTTYRGAPL